MEFDYYCGSQADQFSFIRIPRMLLTEDTFSSLTLQSKMLYSVLLDRMSLSMKNGWFDEENRVYIIYQISEIQADLGTSEQIECTLGGCDFNTSEVTKSTPLEVPESAPLNNKTNINNIYQSKIKSNHIASAVLMGRDAIRNRRRS